MCNILYIDVHVQKYATLQSFKKDYIDEHVIIHVAIQQLYCSQTCIRRSLIKCPDKTNNLLKEVDFCDRQDKKMMTF